MRSRFPPRLCGEQLQCKMHELSIAQSVVENAIDAAEKSGAKKIKSIELEIGLMMMVNPEQLRFAMEIVSKGTIADVAKLKIIKKKVKARCKNGHVSTIGGDFLHLMSSLSCTKCQSRDLEILEGRGIILKKIEAD